MGAHSTSVYKRNIHTFSLSGEVNSMFYFPIIPYSVSVSSSTYCIIGVIESLTWLSPVGHIWICSEETLWLLSYTDFTNNMGISLTNMNYHRSPQLCLRTTQRPNRKLNIVPKKRLTQGTADFNSVPVLGRSSPTALVTQDGKPPLCTIAKGLTTEMKVQSQKNYSWAVTTFHDHFIAITTHDFNFQDRKSLLKPNLNP